MENFGTSQNDVVADIVEYIKSLADAHLRDNQYTHVFCESHQQMRMLLATEYPKGYRLFFSRRTIVFDNGAHVIFHSVDNVADAYKHCGCIIGNLLAHTSLYVDEDMIFFFQRRTRPGYTLTLWEN